MKPSLFFYIVAAFILILILTVSIIRSTGRLRDRYEPLLSSPTPAKETAEGESSPIPASSGDLQPILGLTAEKVLDETVAVYKSAASYADHGFFRLQDESGADQFAPCLIAWKAPRHLRFEVFQAYLVCDGVSLYAQSPLLTGQVLEQSAPERITLERIYADSWFAVAARTYAVEARDDNPAGMEKQNEKSEEKRPPLFLPPQLALLFLEEPLKTLLPSGTRAELLQPDYLDEKPCERIRITSARSKRSQILWIGREERLLYRVEYLEGEKRHACLESGDAQINAEIAPEAFQMEAPDDARRVTTFDPLFVESSSAASPASSPPRPEPTPEDRERVARTAKDYRAVFLSALESGIFSIDWPFDE